MYVAVSCYGVIKDQFEFVIVTIYNKTVAF